MTFHKKLCETKGKGSTSLKGWKIHPKDVCVCVCVCILKAAAAGATVQVSLKGSHGPRCDTRLSMQGLLFPPCVAPGCHWKDRCWSWNFNTLATWCEEPTHWKRPWQWERLKAGGKGDDNDRGWNGWMASTTRWTWVSSFGSWWWTGKPGMLQSMGLQSVGHAWATELNWWF